MVERFANSLRPNAGRLWGTDEKFQRILGSGHWIFTVQDIATRFILACDVSSKKTNYDARDLFRRAQERAGHAPIPFKTDGLKIFRTAFRDVFGKCKGIKPFHLWSSHMRNEYSDNNIHERFNCTLGELLHGCRGLKKVDAALIKAALIHYNHVRPHQSLCGKTPAWKAGIRIGGRRQVAHSDTECSHGEPVRACKDGLYGVDSLQSAQSRPRCAGTAVACIYQYMPCITNERRHTPTNPMPAGSGLCRIDTLYKAVPRRARARKFGPDFVKVATPWPYMARRQS